MRDERDAWAPLRAALQTSRRGPGHRETSLADIDDFMYMGTRDVVTDDRATTIWCYKHVMTRRYLNLSTAGAAFAYAGSDGRYVACELDMALAHALS